MACAEFRQLTSSGNLSSHLFSRLQSIPMMVGDGSVSSLTPIAASNLTTDGQARLDNEIAALILMLSNLRTRRNALSPISCLPSETLASIFILCARGHQNRYSGHRVPDWVNVSHVCRHWREVALNCPTLWSFLFVSSQHWTNELLARSKTAPLKVCIDSGCPKQSNEMNLLRRVAPQADRIQHLRLRLTHQEAERILSLFSSSAPLLQSLWISVERSNYPSEPTLVSRAPFDGDTPALRKLELMNYAFPLASPTLRDLTLLRLRDLGASSRPTLAELKVALSHMQHLTDLHLENALPSARSSSGGQSFEDSEKISFPRLSRLSIVAPFSTVVLLLSCFDLPIQTQVRLRCCFEAGAEDYTPIYPLLAKRFITSNQDFALVPIIRTSFIETASATVGFVFSTAERDSDRRAFSASTTSYDLGQLCEDWDCSIPLKADIVLRTSLPKDREDLVTGIYGSVPLINLRSAHLSFNTGSTLSSAFWTKTFGHLQELRHIRLSGVNLRGLVGVLSLAPHHCLSDESGELDSGSPQVFAPALEELEFCSVDFSEKCRGRSQGHSNDCSCSAPCLCDALSARQAQGYGLLRLIFKECMYVHDFDVADLRESVTDVNWDGVTKTTPDSESEEDEARDECQGPRGRLGMIRFHPLHRDRW